eukprot:gene14839-20893_t
MTSLRSDLSPLQFEEDPDSLVSLASLAAKLVISTVSASSPEERLHQQAAARITLAQLRQKLNVNQASPPKEQVHEEHGEYSSSMSSSSDESAAHSCPREATCDTRFDGPTKKKREASEKLARLEEVAAKLIAPAKTSSMQPSMTMPLSSNSLSSGMWGGSGMLQSPLCMNSASNCTSFQMDAGQSLAHNRGSSFLRDATQAQTQSQAQQASQLQLGINAMQASLQIPSPLNLSPRTGHMTRDVAPMPSPSHQLLATEVEALRLRVAQKNVSRKSMSFDSSVSLEAKQKQAFMERRKTIDISRLSKELSMDHVSRAPSSNGTPREYSISVSLDDIEHANSSVAAVLVRMASTVTQDSDPVRASPPIVTGARRSDSGTFWTSLDI